MIEDLVAHKGRGKFALFADNCSIHKTQRVRDCCKLNKVPLILNIAYCPWFNGVELCFAHWKR